MYEDQFDERVDKQRPYRAEIANAPAHDGDALYVTIDSIDKGLHRWGPCLGWEPRIKNDGTHQMPYVGADALVIFDTDKDLWLLGWWPYA